MSGIREARIEDSAAIKRLSHYFDYIPVSDEVAMNSLQNIINSTSGKVWVFEQDGQIEAWIHVFCAYRVASAPFLEIGGIVVSPDSRGQGIGRSLIAQARQWAGEHKQRLRVRCNTIRDDTHKFYESLGFMKTKSQHVFETS